MKHYILIVLCGLMCPSLSWSRVGDIFWIDNIPYKITVEATSDNDGVVMAGTGLGYHSVNWQPPSSIIIPSSVTYYKKTYLVKSIGCWAFFSLPITSITLPESIERIDNNAFEGCNQLESINIPVKTTHIAKEAFYGCTSLDSISLKNVTEIGSNAFYGCTNIHRLNFSENLESIGESAFKGCSSLSEIRFNSQSVNIGVSAFQNCISLNSVYSQITNLSGLTNANSFHGIAEDAILYIPNGMKSDYENHAIWSTVFPHIYVTLPDENSTFNADINIGDGTENITFKITNLESREVFIESLNGGVVSAKTESVNLEIPAIITDRDLSYHIVGIGDGAFEGTKLQSVHISEGLKVIKKDAFNGCTDIDVISIPNSVVKMENAFKNTSIQNIIVNWRKPSEVTVDLELFNNIYKTATLQIPEGTYQKYSDHPFWGKFEHIIVPNHPITIGDLNTCIGTNGDLGIFLNNTDVISGLQFKLVLPNGIMVNEVNDKFSVLTTERTEGMTIMGRKDPDEENSYLFVMFSLDGNPISGTEGAIMNVRLNVASDVELGTYDINIEDIYMTSASLETLHPAKSSSELKINDYMLGDVNRDDVVDALDASLILQYVAHKFGDENTDFIKAAADANNSGEVDALDASLVLQHAAKKIDLNEIENNGE